MRLTCFRLAAFDPPLWPHPNLSAARYNRAQTGATQYFSLHPHTPWAELLRHEDRRTRERALMLRHPLWAMKVDVSDDVLELTFDTAPEHGLRPEDLVADGMRACQAFAERLRADPAAPAALLAPSAALPGTRNLVVLAPRLVVPYDAEPIAAEDVPTALAAQEGRCPEGLWDRVRFLGSRRAHPALDAWRDGRTLRYAEPPVRLTSPAA